MLKQHDITLLVGISGVGKTYVVDRLIEANDTLVHFSAGSLIKKRLSVVNRDNLRKLSSNQIIQNQYVLVDQFNEELDSLKEFSRIIFDAHMFIDSDDGLLEIPFDILERLRPSRIISLRSDPEVISFRRNKDKSRDRHHRSISELSDQQCMSESLTLNLGERLNIPILKMTSDDISAVDKFIFE